MKAIPKVFEDLINAAENCFFNKGKEKQLGKAIQAAKNYRDSLIQKNLISLFISNRGDHSVGIGGDEIEIQLWRGHIDEDKFLDAYNREVIREIFVDAVKGFWDFPISEACFSDECPDCGTILKKDKCPNKNCISNYDYEEIERRDEKHGLYPEHEDIAN